MNRLSVVAVLSAIVAGTAPAQDVARPLPTPVSTGVPLLDEARLAQFQFELFRRANLPPYNGKDPSASADAQTVGRFTYWYDEDTPPPPPEPPVIKAQRAQLLRILDSAAARFPQDDWTAGQRLRYLSEENRFQDEITAALACRAEQWWCASLLGFAYHEARQFVRADSAYAVALKLMPQRMRCDWTDISVLLEEYSVRGYHRTQCGTPERAAYEERMWWLAKPLYGLAGLDTRTEYFARMTMVRMLEDAPSVYQFGFDIDERELLLRFGWSRAWSSRGSRRCPPPGCMMGGLGAPVPFGQRGFQPPNGMEEVSVVGHEAAPSYQFLPPATASLSPATTDSVDWETGMPPVHARYAPMYARKMFGMTHQSAMFRRGDSALVVLAWDATHTPLGRDTLKRSLSLVLARADSLQPVVTTRMNAPAAGVMVGKGRWGQLLMSAEMTAAGMDSAVRARYGLRPPYAMGARVTLSEMLFFKEYDGLPSSLEEAAPHAMASIKMRNDQKLGVYFESYGTDPKGEKLKVTVTVAREEDEPGFMRRRLQALRLSAKPTTVRVTVEDQSVIGQRTTPRSAYLDVRSLKKGSYIVQLEVEVAGQFVVRSERALEITN